MAKRAFVIAGDRAALIANDITDFQYLSAVHYVPAGVQVPVTVNGAAETQFMLEMGTLELMVGGASSFISGPDFARVPPGVPYAYRNVGDSTARLLVRAAKPEPTFKIIRACIEYAA